MMNETNQKEAGHPKQTRAQIQQANVFVKKRIRLADIQENIQSWINKQPVRNASSHKKVRKPESAESKKIGSFKKPTEILHWDQEKPRENEAYLYGAYDLPYAKPPNEINFIGGIGEQKGHPRSKIFIERPTTIQNIYNMRTRNNPVFTFTENPKEVNSCVSKIYKPQLNFYKEPQEQTYEYFDYNNPLQLDFQGYDYKKTFTFDEQAEENAKEYKTQKNYLYKVADERKLKKVIEIEKRQEQYGLSKMFDLKKVPGHIKDLDNEPTHIAHWTDQFAPEHDIHDPKFVRPAIASVPYKPEPKIQSHLIRATEKEKNIKILEQKYLARRKRVTTRLEKQIQRQEKLKEEEMEKQKLDDENKNKDLGVTEYNDYFTDKHEVVLKEFLSLKPTYKEKKYPSTMRETRYYKRIANRQNRLAKQKAEVKEQFLNECHFEKQFYTFPEKNVHVDEVSIDAESISEQTSDDEDGLSVGNKGSKFKLRGFFTKLVREPRGRIDKMPKSIAERPVRTCITREEWFDLMAPKSKPPLFFKNCPSTLKPTFEPDSEQYSILDPPKAIVIGTYDISPIKEMITANVEGDEKSKRLRPKVIKPPSIKVKKFNLTGFLYGKVKTEKNTFTISRMESKGQNKCGIPLEVIERSNDIFEENQRKKMQKEAQRLQILGISMALEPTAKKDKGPDVVESSTDDDWVPEQFIKKPDVAREWGLVKSSRFCPHLTSGIKAPQFREPVVGKCACNVTTANQENNYNLNLELPQVVVLPEDIVKEPNLEMEKKKYNKVFETRHHHKHFDNSQHKQIMVKYLFKVPSLGVKKEKGNFDTNEKRRLSTGVKEKEYPMPVINEFFSNVLKSKQSPLIKRFVAFLHDRLLEGQKSMGIDRGYDDDFKNATIKELKADLESIMSCCSSNTSSDVTNFTQDSGSYFDIQNVKVPLRYMTKNQVPFYEVNRIRVRAQDFTKLDEYYHPYYFPPFCGQEQVMRKISKPKDHFYTNLVRARADIRARLKVDLPSFNEEQIGEKGKKYISKLITEWDDYYQHEIKNRPRICNMKCGPLLEQSRKALRKRFIALYSSEKITQLKIAEKILNRYFDEFYEFRDLCEKLFSSWKEEYYRSSMKTLQDLEPEFAVTRQMQIELDKLCEDFRRLNMQIVYMENDWITCIGYQNFHYLLADLTWRHEHDWIHRDPETNGMENARKSIENRFIVNIRNRDRDDAFEIKHYYETVFQRIAKPPLYPFKTPTEFHQGLVNIKTRLYISLVHMHVKIWTLVELTKQYEEFVNKSNIFLDNREKYVNHRSKKKNFLQKQSQNLEENGYLMFDTDLTVSFSNHEMLKIQSLCECMYEFFVPLAVRNELKLNFTIIDKFGMVADTIVNILGQLDKFSIDMLQDIEKKVRIKKTRTMKISENSCALENRIHFVMQSVLRNLQPPYKKPKREGKLPRSYLIRRKKKVIIPVPQVDKRLILFYRAFTENGKCVFASIDELNDEDYYIFKQVFPDVESPVITVDDYRRLKSEEIQETNVAV